MSKHGKSNNQNEFKIPSGPASFAKMTWKKFKKKYSDEYDGKKDTRRGYDSLLVEYLPDTIEFLVRYNGRHDKDMDELRNRIYGNLVDKKFIKYLEKQLEDDREIDNIKYFPIIVRDIIIAANEEARRAKAENPNAEFNLDFTDLQELSLLILKKKIRKLKKKDVDEDVSFDVLSIIPTPKVLEGKQFRYRMGNVMKVLYEHAKTKEISYENIIESVIPVEYASQVISFNLLERLSRTQNFNDSQKKFNAQVTEWVFTTMESMDRSTIEAILKNYVDIRKRDLANNNDADRRFLLKSVPEDEFPNLKKVINNYMETHQDDVKFF